MSCKSSNRGSADVGNSSVGDSDTVAHQTMADNTTVGDAMADDTTVGNAMADTNDSSGEGSSAIVSDFGDISINVVGVVVDVLDPSVGQVDGVVALPGSSAVVSLGSVETGSRIVVSNGILVGVRGDLVGVDLSDGMGNWVSNGMTDNSMADTYTMTNANPMANAHSVAKTNTMANSSKQLGSGRGSSQEGGDRKESLRTKQVKEIVQCNASELLVPASCELLSLLVLTSGLESL